MCGCVMLAYMPAKFLPKIQNINGRGPWTEVRSFIPRLSIHMHATSNGELGRALKHDYVEQTYIHKAVI